MGERESGVSEVGQWSERRVRWKSVAREVREFGKKVDEKGERVG